MLNELKFIQSFYKKRKKININYEDIPESKSGYLVAVDGGSCILADGGVWIISKLRIASVEYDNSLISKKTFTKDYYYTLIKDKVINHSFPFLKAEFGNIRELNEAPAITMKTLELKRALELINDIPKGAVLLIDGLLIPENNDQNKLLISIKQEALKKGINVVGFAKTFRQGVNGRSLIGLLLGNNLNNTWLYKTSDYLILKLHKRTKYAYAINYIGNDLKTTLSILAYYSKDPEIIGYPYPLIKVDRIARISSYERIAEMNKLRIICKREKFDFIELDERSTNMHSLMDKQKYK